MGFVELYGWLLAAATGQPTTGGSAPNGLPVTGRRPSLHRHVLAVLGHHPPPAVTGCRRSGSVLYAEAGVPLTTRAAALADLVQVAEVDFAATPTDAVTGPAAGAVEVTAAAVEDRRVGDGAVLACLHHLVLTHGRPATTPRARAGFAPPLFGPDGRLASLFGHLLPTWGLSPAEAAGHGPTWAVTLLAWSGWQVSDRAGAAIGEAQHTEAAGRTWGEALDSAAAAAARIGARADWDQ